MKRRPIAILLLTTLWIVGISGTAFAAEQNDSGRARSRGRQAERGQRSDREERRGEPQGHRGRFERLGEGSTKERFQRRYQEYIKWLGQTDPNRAKELAELKKENPRLYMAKVAASYRRNRRLFENSQDNPEYAKVLKEDIQLRHEVYRLLRELKTTEDQQKKAELQARLKDLVSQRYDVILRRKQFEYEQLLERLERLKVRIKESKAELQKRKTSEYKQQNVQQRLKELLEGRKKFNWD